MKCRNILHGISISSLRTFESWLREVVRPATSEHREGATNEHESVVDNLGEPGDVESQALH